MKRILFLLLLSLFLILPAVAQSDKTLPEVFVSDDENMTLRYPTGWAVQSDGAGEAIVATSPMMFDFNGEVIPPGEAAILIIFPYTNGNFIDPEGIYVSGEPVETLNRIIQRLGKQATGVQLRFSDPEAITLDNHSAARADGSAGDNDAVIMVVDYGDDTFSFMLGVTARNQLGKYGPKLTAIAESVNVAPT